MAAFLLRRTPNLCTAGARRTVVSAVKIWSTSPMVIAKTSYSTSCNQQYLWRYRDLVTFHQLLRRPKSTSSSTMEAGDTNTLGSKVRASADTEVVYIAPLKGAVRAIKVFSLTTAVAAFFGGPTLVWLGNPSVPVIGRVMMSTVVMLVGLGTTGLLHWLVKGYIMKMEYNRQSGDLFVKTISVLGTLKKHHFHISEAEPPSKATAFSSFQAKGKSFFMHSEVFQDRELLSKILGAYSVFEDPKMWEDSQKDQ